MFVKNEEESLKKWGKLRGETLTIQYILAKGSEPEFSKYIVVQYINRLINGYLTWIVLLNCSWLVKNARRLYWFIYSSLILNRILKLLFRNLQWTSTQFKIMCILYNLRQSTITGSSSNKWISITNVTKPTWKYSNLIYYTLFTFINTSNKYSNPACSSSN